VEKVTAVQKDHLINGPSTPGIKRDFAFKGEGVLALRSITEPGIVSGWHRHGDYLVYGYMAKGSMLLEFGSEGKESVLVEEGGFFHVPPHTTHRETNPSKTEGQEIILFLTGKGDLVQNLEGPEKD
jgi:quercetin dioxygenase-like cupin family protein